MLVMRDLGSSARVGSWAMPQTDATCDAVPDALPPFRRGSVPRSVLYRPDGRHTYESEGIE